MKPESFEKFYYAKVGLGEGCGCAERVIDVHEFNRLGGRPQLQRRTGGLELGRVAARLAAKLYSMTSDRMVI
jgi:hypothetical protein